MLTGCTGFIGKVMVEKLLRSIPKIGKIFLLVRGKRSQTATDRVKEILTSKIFSKLKKDMGEENFM